MPIKSLVAAFAMYSRVPMPKVELSEDDMKYIFCFFPLIGTVLAAVMYFSDKLLKTVGAGNVMYGVFMTLIPVIITGGIHFD
ncbi:MAG: adenosylcobinamide-GDP ribazoletransferase [Firmicutes bacterium]|nr:adenosylcobinamide-GDP ribazoletransferase [Bacillota bacterium]